MRLIESAKSSGKEVRRTTRKADEVASLSITSLLDVLTILLVFLIKNVSMEAQRVTVPENMTFPSTMTVDELEDYMGTTIVKVYPDIIYVGLDNIVFGKPEALLSDPKKREELYTFLSYQSDQILKVDDQSEACLMIQANDNIPTQVITEIVAVGTGAKFKHIYFSTLLDTQWLNNMKTANSQ